MSAESICRAPHAPTLHHLNPSSILTPFACFADHCYERESIPFLIYAANQCYKFIHAGEAIQPNFYTSHRTQHFKDLYPFVSVMNPLLYASLGLPSDSGRCRVQVHKYHHVGHPTTPWEAQEGGESACASPAAQALPLSLQCVGLTMMRDVVSAGMMEFWSAHTAFLLGARTGVSKRPTPIGHILGMLRVASAHGLWISFIQGRTFHDIQMDGLRYTVAKRENSAKDFRREGERKEGVPLLLPLLLVRCLFGRQYFCHHWSSPPPPSQP